MTDFTFHNVGQGLFYTGRVDDFNFIYDCGSERRTHLNSVIGNYKNRKLVVPKVDLLILSHLHDDHVSGLNLLFDKGVSIDTVILPYLTPIERLAVALKRINLPLWFYDFWADPVTFLFENGVNKIVMIGGREARSPESIPQNEGLPENKDEKLDIDEMPEDKELRREVVENDGQLQAFLGQRRLFTKGHDGYLKAKHVWFFRFFNCKVADSNLNSFKQCVRTVIKGDDLIGAIRSKSQLKELKKCYTKLKGDFNDTSLVVYHAPILQDKFEILCSQCTHCPYIYPNRSFSFPVRFGINLQRGFGHFLTGDINLNNKWNEIQRHFNAYFPEIALVSLPHHGAKDNWDNAILGKVAHVCSYVVSAGISNKYGHPSFKILNGIIAQGDNVYWSNELNEISLQYLLHS